ncbi:MAG: proline racemase family protein, partial [Rhodospirillales bacterium]|nr:proline racemase family protein [Rhodospirillales bacterium]
MSMKSQTGTFTCIDAHTCGNPVRVVAGGGPELDGATMLERRRHFLAEYDWIRTGLMYEPRGHEVMSGSILYEPTRDDCDLGILFIEVSGCLPMCGHGTIGTVTVALERGLVTPKTPGVLRLDTPAGLVEATYCEENGRVSAVRITNVASFLVAENLEVEVPAGEQHRVLQQARLPSPASVRASAAAAAEAELSPACVDTSQTA